jgi:hypothetical protein
MFKRKTDDEFIASLERQSKYIRLVGALFLIIGFITAGFAIAKTFEIQDQIIRIADALAAVDVKDEKSVVHAANETSYALGLKFGFALASSVALGSVLCAFGFHFLLGWRKERLLIQLNKRSGGEHET